jgi:hypothetical protein
MLDEPAREFQAAHHTKPHRYFRGKICLKPSPWSRCPYASVVRMVTFMKVKVFPT